MTSLHGQLAQLEGLGRLQRRFEAYVKNEREPIRVALFALKERFDLGAKCCEDADVDWLPSLTKTDGGEDGIYVEWDCREHGAGQGTTFALHMVASQLST